MKSKILSLTLACLLSAWGMYAQNNEVLISNAAAHVLYRNHNNPLQISVPGVSHAALSVTCDKAVVTKDQNGLLWHINPTDSIAETVTLKIYNTTSGQKCLIQEKICQVVDLQREVFLHETKIVIDPETGLEKEEPYEYKGFALRSTPRKSLNERTEILADYPLTSMLSNPVPIFEYTATIHEKDFVCEGNKFSEEILKAISQLRSGDKMLLSNISVKDSEGTTSSPKSCVIVIR